MNAVLPRMLTALWTEAGTPCNRASSSTTKVWARLMKPRCRRGWAESYQFDPKFSNPPGFRDKGSDELRIKAAEKYAGSIEDFEAIQFTKGGKPLSPSKNAEKKYGILARIMVGEKVTPAEASKFIEAGKKAERRNQSSRSAGSLSSGKSNQQISSQAGSFQTNADLFDTEAIELYHRQQGRLEEETSRA